MSVKTKEPHKTQEQVVYCIRRCVTKHESWSFVFENAKF